MFCRKHSLHPAGSNFIGAGPYGRSDVVRNRRPQPYSIKTKSPANVYVAPISADVVKVAALPYRAPTKLIGSSVSDRIVTELLRTKRHTLVERSQMANVLSETEPTLAGHSQARAVEVAKMLGADGVVIGTVTEYVKIAARGKTYPSVGIACRLIDTRTGETVWSADTAQRGSSAATPLAQHSREVIHEIIAGVFGEMARVR